MDLPICFGPLEFARIMFGFEMSIAFGPTELEQFRIVSDELDAMARIDRA